jgi:glutamate dehydrogenase/leucine dehydrogenase
MAKSELQKIKIVLPYIVASCPETFASYLEFQQNRENRFFDRKDIDKRIEEKSRDVINLVYSESKKHAKNLEDAAFILALQNIATSFSKK